MTVVGSITQVGDGYELKVESTGDVHPRETLEVAMEDAYILFGPDVVLEDDGDLTLPDPEVVEPAPEEAPAEPAPEAAPAEPPATPEPNPIPPAVDTPPATS